MVAMVVVMVVEMVVVALALVVDNSCSEVLFYPDLVAVYRKKLHFIIVECARYIICNHIFTYYLG